MNLNVENPDLYKTIGQRVKKAREKVGLSQQKLADLLGYKTAGAVSHFETGFRRINIADLKKLSEILGVSLESLIGDNEDKSNEASTNLIRIHVIKCLRCYDLGQVIDPFDQGKRKPCRCRGGEGPQRWPCPRLTKTNKPDSIKNGESDSGAMR